MKSFLETFKESRMNEASLRIDSVELYNLGTFIPKSLCFVAQIHLAHILITEIQNHEALGSLYSGLDSSIDLLAEQFVSVGGNISGYSFELESTTDLQQILNKVEIYFNEVSYLIKSLKDRSDLSSISDTLISIQGLLNTFIFKFKI